MLRATSTGRGGGIRTHDPLLPKQMRYQAALRPEEARILQIGTGQVNHTAHFIVNKLFMRSASAQQHRIPDQFCHFKNSSFRWFSGYDGRR